MKKILILISALFIGAAMQSCLKDNVEDYESWRQRNDEYLNGLDLWEYQKITTNWAPFHEVYMKWHNDREKTKDNLVPMSTSTASVTYWLRDIDSVLYDTSYRTNGDSLYTAVVNNNVTGLQIALTNMHVGDSVTLIVPYNAGYGNVANGSLKPYTNLIYEMKLVDIPALEKPNN